jgi:catechol-2,3-dioxygenase
MKTRVHVSLSVSDLEKSTAFYSALFGAMPSKVREDYANYRLDAPSLHLALVHAPEQARDNGNRHYGIEMFANDELEQWRARLKNMGMQLRDEEQVTCCYAVADKFWAQDPDGNEWEFWVRSEEADSMHGEASQPAPAAATKNACAPGGGCC